MDNELLKKRILETNTEIFPLDRLLPLESVYKIFEQEYAKSEDKTLFLTDRKFQRLREGYFAMFVAISLQDTSGHRHYLIFPSNPDNDVYICYRINEGKDEKPKLVAYEFDIKEYTNWSPNFKEFADASILPKIDVYNLAIPTYKSIDGGDIQPLIDYLNAKNLTNRIWLLGLPSDDIEEYSISGVTIIDRNGIVYNETINLNDWIDKTAVPMVYQDVIRFKEV